jgi:hypothetical protein
MIAAMSPFSIFFARLVDLLGAEIAAKVVREFAGQTIQFPITGHYNTTARNDFGFPALVPVIGEGFKPQPITHSPLTEAEANELAGKLIQGRVTKYLSIRHMGVEYDVSHLPHASVGDVIAVTPENLPALNLNRFALAAESRRSNNRDDEKSPSVAGLQGQSGGHAPLGACRHAQTNLLRHHERSPEGVESQAACNPPAIQPVHGTRSSVHPIDPANVDRS